MVRIVSPEGGIWHEAPFTEEEEMELYRLAAYKPGATFLHGPRPPVEAPQPPPAAPPLPEQFKTHREQFEGRRRMVGFCRWMKSRYAPDTVGKPAKLLVLSPKPKT